MILARTTQKRTAETQSFAEGCRGCLRSNFKKVEDIRERAEARDRQYRLGNYARLALLFVVAASSVIGFHEVRAIVVRIALLVAMPALFWELLLRLRWRVEEHDKPRGGGSGKTVIVEESARIVGRIRQTECQIAWNAATCIGWPIYLFWQTTPLTRDIARISGVLLALLFYYVCVLIKRLTGLRPELTRAERDLKYHESHG